MSYIYWSPNQISVSTGCSENYSRVKAPQHHYVTMVKHNSNACLCLYPSNSSVQQPDSQVNNSVHCGLRELELLLTELTAHFLLENLYKYVLHPIPFLWRRSLIDNLSSLVKGMFINKLWRNNDITLMTLRCVFCRVASLHLLGSSYSTLENICTKFTQLFLFCGCCFFSFLDCFFSNVLVISVYHV